MNNRARGKRHASDPFAGQAPDFMARSLPANQITTSDSFLADSPGQEQLAFHDVDFAPGEETTPVDFYLQKIVDQRTAELRQMITELEEVSYALVHDMSAPLRAVHGFAELLRNEANGAPPEAKNYLERIIGASKRIEKSIQDALTYHRTVFRVLPLQAVDLDGLVRHLINSKPEFRESDADIRVDMELPVVLGNESLLTQCLWNLLDNAVKFVAPGTRPQVRIRAERTSEFARIWIEDNGIGIAGPAQKRLFGMFQKLNPESEGTGLGLAIVRKAVERMNGKLGVESEPGRGSRFWVEFRRADWPLEPLPEETGSHQYA